MSQSLENQVQVSRMTVLLSMCRADVAGKAVSSAPHVDAHVSLLHMRNSEHRSICTLNAHFVDYDAVISLRSPRHRCYALLSSALSWLVR